MACHARTNTHSQVEYHTLLWTLRINNFFLTKLRFYLVSPLSLTLNLSFSLYSSLHFQLLLFSGNEQRRGWGWGPKKTRAKSTAKGSKKNHAKWNKKVNIVLAPVCLFGGRNKRRRTENVAKVRGSKKKQTTFGRIRYNKPLKLESFFPPLKPIRKCAELYVSFFYCNSEHLAFLWCVLFRSRLSFSFSHSLYGCVQWSWTREQIA